MKWTGGQAWTGQDFKPCPDKLSCKCMYVLLLVSCWSWMDRRTGHFRKCRATRIENHIHRKEVISQEACPPCPEPRKSMQVNELEWTGVNRPACPGPVQR